MYAAEHNYAEAGQALAKLKSFHPRSAKAPDALLTASRYFLKVGDTENARIVLNAVLIEYPQSSVRTEAQFELGRMYLTAGDPDRALREFKRLQTEVIPAELRARTLAAIGQAQSDLGNRTEAETRLREVISTYPTAAAAQEARVLLGDLQRGFREYEAAAQNYRAVAENTAAPAELRMRAFVGQADASLGNKNYAGALAAYESLFKQFPPESVEPDMIRAAAQAARQAGDHTRAQILLEKLIADTLVTVDRRTVLAELGDIAREGRSYAAAVAWYRRYVQQFTNDAGAPFALYRIAEINEEDFRNNSEALTLYGSVIERFGMTRLADDAQLGKARVLDAQDRGDLAAEAYAQLVAQYPASEYVVAADRKTSLFTGGAASDAGLEKIAAAVSTLQDKPGDGSVDLLLGALYLEDLKRYDKAERAYESATRKGLTGPEAEEAAWGFAMSLVRMAATEKRPLTEAVQRCETFFSSYGNSARRDELGWALLQLQLASASPAEVLETTARFIALQPQTHREDALIAAAEALSQLGRYEEAEKEFTGVVEAAGKTQAGAAAWYGRARVRNALQHYEDALGDLGAYEALAPDGRHAAQALFLRGQILERVGRYNDAVEVYQRLASRFVYSSLADSARIAEVRALVSAGDPKQAMTRSSRYLREIEENPFLVAVMGPGYLYNHAVTLAQARERTAARKALLHYLQLYPDGGNIAEVYFALGQMYKDEGKIDLASSYLQQSAAMGQGGGARREAADLLLESNRFEAAIGQYEKLAAATTLPAEQLYARSRIIVALYRSGKLEEADRRAAEFLSANPDTEAAADEFDVEKGKHFFKQSDYRKAADLFEEVEDSDMSELAALGMYWSGRCFEAQNKNADAVTQFEKVISKYPGTQAGLEATMSLARINLRGEKYQEAAILFKNAVDAGNIPDAMLKEALSGLITSYEGLKIYESAIEMTRKFIEAYPSDPTVFRKRVNLGVFYYQLRYFDKAILHLEELLSDATPDDQAEIRYYIGESYYYKGDFNQAALEFLKVPYLVLGKTEIDWSASSYYMAGQAYEKLSKPALAMEMYEKIISTPGFDARFKAQAEKELARVKALME